MIDWHEQFRTAHLTSWPSASLCIQNVRPGNAEGARNIFKDDEAQIESAAKAFGYKRISPRTAKVISYVKP